MSDVLPEPTPTDKQVKRAGVQMVGASVVIAALLVVVAVLGLTVFRQIHIIDALADGVSQQRDQFTACKNKPSTTKGCTTPVAAEPSVIVKQGSRGPVGLTGGVGPSGPPGPQGPQGPTGKQGVPGPVGKTGPAPGCLLLVSACSGSQGTEGKQGPIGPAGKQGDPGPAGAQGPQGNDGKQGEAGPAGPAGPPGVVGAQGPPGPVCPDGYHTEEKTVLTTTAPIAGEVILTCEPN
jgi:hypothetical protein